ncbi:DsrE/DsrF/DrsH-like family protein [Candidatus Saccharibacteria bacterium]|nr:DsrE/DsrF/DrsH-like family protein [Candidatus Saccharibacteria bacterium]
MSESHKKEHQDHNRCHTCGQCKDCAACRCEPANGPALKKMMIIVSKASIDGIYAGLILANGARSEGIECDMFFTFFGLDAITKKRMEHLKVGLGGNPGMHMPEVIGVFPGMESVATHMMMKRMSELDIPPVPEFLDIIKAAGGRIFACKLAMEMFNLKREDMWDGVDEVLTVGQFYECYTPGSQIIFI